MESKNKQVPLIIMLVAGLATSIVTWLMHYKLETALWILLAVLIVFYLMGFYIKRLLDRFDAENEEAAAISDGEVIEKDSEETEEAAPGPEGQVTQTPDRERR